VSDLAPAPLAERILVIRGLRVMLDADLAALYGVTTKRFNEQVKRNIARFPVEFMFQLTAEEFRALRSQIATSNEGWSQIATASPGRGGRHRLPYAFSNRYPCSAGVSPACQRRAGETPALLPWSTHHA
jgi:hypothetical protein